MPLTLRILPRAEREIAHASQWWIENRPDAGSLFEGELMRAFTLLCEHPLIGQSSRSARWPQLRRILLPRTRYFLYYSVHRDQGAVEVFALWHAGRGSQPGQ